MLPGWLLKDDFLWQELFKLFLSLIGSLFLAWLIQIVITKRDQKNQEIESRRSQINELRGELVQIFNEYYKIRKRYKTIRDTLLGRKERNPYVKGQSEKINEILDGLLITCMELEARYSTLLDRLRVSFPEFWENKLAFLMLGRSAIDGSHKSYPQLIKEIRYRLEAGQDIRDSNLEAYFHVMRLQIEDEQDIDAMLRQCVTETFHSVLSAFDSYENDAAFLYRQPKKE
ncbi:MAG: hypothetical protein AAFV90_24075 [Cyanobacteria bacterium J06634_5]